MKTKFRNKKVVTKCDITLELENDNEILAMKNICSFAESECFRLVLNPEKCKDELKIIKQLRSALDVV